MNTWNRNRIRGVVLKRLIAVVWVKMEMVTTVLGYRRRYRLHRANNNNNRGKNDNRQQKQ